MPRSTSKARAQTAEDGEDSERAPHAPDERDRGQDADEPGHDADAPASAAEEIAALGGDPNFMTSLARGLAVIRAFSQHRRQQTIADLARRTGLPRATVRRCLYTLEQLGYVASDGRFFSLRPKILTLGFSYLSSRPLAEVAQPFLERVSHATLESSSLTVLDGDDIIYIARSASRRVMSVALNVGSRLPAYCTSMGRVLLAALSEEEFKAYLQRVALKRMTQHTIATRTELTKLIKQVRERGFAISDQELELGLRSIAVPVRDVTGKVVAAMNVGLHAARATPAEMEKQFLPQLQRAATDLGSMLIRQ